MKVAVDGVVVMVDLFMEVVVGEMVVVVVVVVVVDNIKATTSIINPQPLQMVGVVALLVVCAIVVLAIVYY